MPLEFAALDEGLAAFGADVDTRSVGMQVLPHGRVVPEHLGAALVRTRYRPVKHVTWRLLHLQLVARSKTIRRAAAGDNDD